MSTLNFLRSQLSHRPKFWTMVSGSITCFLVWLAVFINFSVTPPLESAPPAMAGLAVSVQFGWPDTIGPGNVTRLTLTLSNSDGITHEEVALTNTLPAAITIATPAQVETDCNAVWSAPDGGTEIQITNGRLGVGESCFISLNVTSSTAGTHTNTTGAISSNLGSYTTGTDDLIVDASYTPFSLSVSPTKILPGQTARLTYTIDNSANGSAISSSFTHMLPSGLVVADLPNASAGSGCTAYAFIAGIPADPPSGDPGDQLISYYQATSANSICTLEINVTATVAGIYELNTSSLSTGVTSPGFAVAVLDGSYEPFSKRFVPQYANGGQSIKLIYTIDNIARESELTNLAFTDDLSTVLSGLVATDLPQNDVCGSGSTLSGSSTIALTNGSLPVDGTCSFEVTLSVPSSAVLGTYTSTSSQLTGLRNGSPFMLDEAADRLIVSALPEASLSISPQTAAAGETITVTYAITNSSTTDTMDPISFDLIFEEFINGATIKTQPSNGYCGASSTTNIVYIGDSNVAGLAFTGGSLSPNSSCTFAATLQIPDTHSQGSFMAEISSFEAEVNGTDTPGEATGDSLTIVAPPVFKAELLNNPNLPGGTVEIVYTLDHSGGEDSDPAAAATNLSFTLDLDGALSGLAAIGSPQSDGCGAGSTLTGTSSLTFSGGSLQPGEICTMTTTVQIPAGVAMGDYPLNTSTLAADVGGVSLTAPASSPVLDIDLISLSAQFVPTTTLPSETVEIEFKITNYSSSHAASSLALNQDLSDIFSGLTTSAVPTFDVCGGGSSLLVLSSTIVYLNAGSVASNSSCTFRLSVNMPAGAADGIYTGQTASLSGTIDGTGFTMAGVPTTFVVDATRLAFEKAFVADPSNLPGVAQSLVYTITNTDSANTIDTITFTDDLDGVLIGLTATGLPLSDICGSGSSISGTSSLTFSGGALAPGESCSFTVPVAVPGTAEAANYPSTSSEITGDLGGLAVKGNPASDTLKVAQLGIAHSFATAGAPNTTVSVTVSISNTGLIDTLDGLSFIDTLDFTLPGLTAINLPISDVCGPGSVLSGGSTLTLSNASLREFENCTFELELLLPRNVPLNSYDHTINALQQEGVDVSLPSTATLTIVRPEVSVTNTITPTDLMPGQPITATVTYTNSGIGSATEIYISNPLPPEVDVTGVITNGAILTQTTVNGISIVEQDFMASGNSQTVEVVGVVNPLLNSDGLISAVTSITATADVSTTNNTQPISFNLTMPTASIGTDSVAVSVAEEAGSVPIIVTLDSINPYAPVILTYQTTDGTATSGSDFTGTAAGTLTIPAGSDSGSFTIPILDDSAVEADETFTIILTASQGGKIASTNTAVVTILNTDVLPAVPTPTPTATPTPAPISDPPQQEIYLPGILHSTVQAPDLIVQSTTLGSDGVTIVVQNVGSRPVTDGFWVDLIIDPSTPPTQANDTVGALGARGLVWGVDGSDIPLQSGDTLTLTLNDKYFRPGLATASSIPADVPVYVHVDSANELTTYGAVEELHEITQESYNNILMVVPTEETIVIISGRTTVPSGTSAPLPIRPSEAE